MPSAAQLLQDIQEEIGFAQSEKMEEKDIEEYECEDAHQNLYAHLVEKIEEAYPQEDPTHKEKQNLSRNGFSRGRGRARRRSRVIWATSPRIRAKPSRF